MGNDRGDGNRCLPRGSGPGAGLKRTLISLLLVCAGAAACAPRVTRFNIVDYRADGQTVQFFEQFDECYYSIEPDGHFDIVARRAGVAEADPAERITQVVHLRGIWHPRPGQTYAERTMINSTVSYMILSGGGGASFEGAGFVSFQENHNRTAASGQLELARLAPVRRLGEGRQLFERAEIYGGFKGVRDERRVKRILTEMRRLFGPMPRYEGPPTETDVL